LGLSKVQSFDVYLYALCDQFFGEINEKTMFGDCHRCPRLRHRASGYLE
jgi:hypothetical protein